MGNKFGTHAFPTEAVIAETTRTVNTFAAVYLKAIAISTLRHAQETKDMPKRETIREKNGYQLDEPPIAEDPMETGYITKLGEIKKNWKKRYFVATDAADNFVLCYFEKEKDASSINAAKGSIYPCGYLVREATPEEIPEKDGFGLVLEPIDFKRTWFFRFDTAEHREAWKQALQYATVHCEAPLNADPVLAGAFKDAYERTRRKVGVTGYHQLDRQDRDQLALLAIQACETNVLAPLYEKIAEGVTGGAGAGTVELRSPAEALKLRQSVDKELHRIVFAIIEIAWPLIQARADMLQPPLHDICHVSFPTILREESMGKADVSDRISKHLRPLIKDIITPIVGTMLGAFIKPQYKAHKDAIKMFWSGVSSTITAGLKENDLRILYRDIKWQEKSLKPILGKIRVLTREDLDAGGGESALKLLSELTVSVAQLKSMMNDYSLYEVGLEMEEHVRSLLGWAIFSFVAEVESVRGTRTPMQCLQRVMPKLIADSKTRQMKCLLSILRQIVMPLLRKEAVKVPVINEIFKASVVHSEPPQAILTLTPTVAAGKEPAMPAGVPVVKSKKAMAEVEAGVKAATIGQNFLDADWMLEAVFEEVVESMLAPVIEPRLAAFTSKLEKLPGKLGFSSA